MRGHACDRFGIREAIYIPRRRVCCCTCGRLGYSGGCLYSTPKVVLLRVVLCGYPSPWNRETICSIVKEERGCYGGSTKAGVSVACREPGRLRLLGYVNAFALSGVAPFLPPEAFPGPLCPRQRQQQQQQRAPICLNFPPSYTRLASGGNARRRVGASVRRSSGRSW